MIYLLHFANTSPFPNFPIKTRYSRQPSDYRALLKTKEYPHFPPSSLKISYPRQTAHELAHLTCITKAFKTRADELLRIAQAGKLVQLT